MAITTTLIMCCKEQTVVVSIIWLHISYMYQVQYDIKICVH